MKAVNISLVLLFFMVNCTTENDSEVTDNKLEFIHYVNPFIGTKKMGHTYPGATTPFGMVQLSPQTDNQPMFIDGKYNKKTYEYCAGYQYEDSVIYGFSHTHFSGTGHSDLGDIRIMPSQGELLLEPGNPTTKENGYYDLFSHDHEFAEPGYYSVLLRQQNIKADLTATERVGFHKYTFPKDDTASIILDLVANIYDYEGKNVWTFVRVENDSTITGYRQTTGWARTRKVFFALRFSKPFIAYGHNRYEEVKYNGFYRKFNQEHNFPEMAGRNIRAYFNFDCDVNEEIKLKVALSSVSTKGALLNLETETPHWDFEKTKLETQKKWDQELSKIVVETQTKEQKETFYSAFYHTMLSPVLYEDVDGSYRGLDQNIHPSDDFTNYTIFSLWDTYRALHPLFNIIQPSRNNDMVKSMLAHYNQSVHGMLPVWSHYANENWCMVGYHSVSVIADAIVKNTTNVDLEQALEACISTANVGYYDGIDSYVKRGYVAEDLSPNSVSKTLEYAYNDWCIAQIAGKAESGDAVNEYMARSQNYLNVFDSTIIYMRPRLQNGEWRENFDPMDTHGQGFIEGNAWNYGLYVPHDIDNMISMMGGKDKFSRHLDTIFNTEIEDRFIEKNEDITKDGIIGNYVHGNEPGHHIPYLYNWTNQPWKTQERVRMIMDDMYDNKVDGLCGNDDAGQMSAWYIFSALGFYPVCPGSEYYSIGSPLIDNAEIKFENGSKLKIIVKNQGIENIYVEKVELNGKLISNLQINHHELMKGGELRFFMSDKIVE